MYYIIQVGLSTSRRMQLFQSCKFPTTNNKKYVSISVVDVFYVLSAFIRKGLLLRKKKNNTLKYLFRRVTYPWINRKYKDTVFRLLFNDDKKALLELYNAINHSDYADPEALVVNTLDNAIFMGMHNDLSFIIDTHLNIYEHQSTNCPNMPLRCLFYVSKLYAQIVDENRIYSSRIRHIPEPHFVVFYNGVEPLPEEMSYKLSDMYDSSNTELDLELKVKVLNINRGMNPALMDSCEKLSGYSVFVAKVREYNESSPIEDAVPAAIDYCIDNNILKGFFEKQRKAITMFSLYEYDYKSHLKSEREDGFEEGASVGEERGIAIGEERGIAIGGLKKLASIAENMKNNGYSVEQISNITGASVSDIEKALASNDNATQNK